jgi:peptidoglycan DL-endopeptidase CwlO
MSNLISTSSIASGSIIYPEHVLRSIQALRGETDTLFILSGSLVVSASDVRYPNLLENPTPTAFIAFNTSSGNFYWTTNQSSTSPSAYVSTGSVSGNTLTFTKGDNTTFDLIVSATGSSADSLVTASISGTTLTFTKGDSSTFNLTIASSSYALNSTNASNADLLDGLNSTAFVLNSQTSSMTVLSASFAANASSSLRAVSSSYAVTASYALNAGGSGGTSFYQITLNMSGGIIDIGGTPIASVLGPNGENKATLEGLGWSFSTPTSTRLTVGRPASSQVQPLINIMTHGNNSGNVFSKAPTGQSTGAFSAVQTLATGAYTTFDLYSISNTNTGCAASGATTVVVTFGLIS